MNVTTTSPPLLGINLIRMAVTYLLLGLLLGIGMAASHHFELRSLHTHINLLGWATMAISGLVYCMFPHAAANRLATAHFWLHSLGLPLMMFGLGGYSLGHHQFEPLIAMGALLVTAGLLLFAVVTYVSLAPRHRRQGAAEPAHDTSAAH
jgi:hypothetical protein